MLAYRYKFILTESLEYPESSPKAPFIEVFETKND